MTTEQKSFIRKHPELTDQQIAGHIGKSEKTVAYWRRIFGIPTPKQAESRKTDAFVAEHYRKDMTAQQIANRLGKSTSAVYNIACACGLQKPNKRHK